MLTPQNKTLKLAKAIGLNADLYLKREDLHPYSSHKGRSIPLMIERYAKKGWRNFVISSSGNAGLAAAYAVKKYNDKEKNNKINLKIFVGENIDGGKFQRILRFAQDDRNIEIKQVLNPKQQAFLLDKTGKTKNLRQSTDDLALFGYYELAKELSKIKNLSAVFIPTSSGTTAQGLYEGFKKLKLKPQIHVVQTDYCHPIVGGHGEKGRGKIPPSPSIANAIVDKIAHRKKNILKIIKNSRGSGWMANNKEIGEIIKLVAKNEKIKISANSALSLVGLRQAVKAGWKLKGKVACLITGK